MDRIFLEGTNRLPKIILDKQVENFEISGNSNHRNVNDYFLPVFEWIDNYTKDPLEKTVFKFKMNYYDSVSSLLIFRIFQKLQLLKDIGNQVHVKWFYRENDDNIFDVGVDFKEIFLLDIDLIKQN